MLKNQAALSKLVYSTVVCWQAVPSFLSVLCWSAFCLGPIILSLLCVLSYLKVYVNTAALSNSHNSVPLSQAWKLIRTWALRGGLAGFRAVIRLFHFCLSTLCTGTTNWSGPPPFMGKGGGGGGGEWTGKHPPAGWADQKEDDEIKDQKTGEPIHPQAAPSWAKRCGHLKCKTCFNK